jgi:hypothetical protein
MQEVHCTNLLVHYILPHMMGEAACSLNASCAVLVILRINNPLLGADG